MAFTINREHTVFGNKKVVLMSCSIDTASGNIDTGLSVVDAVLYSPVSCATAALTVKKNVGSNSTSIPGYVNINSGAAGDSFQLVIYGR